MQEFRLCLWNKCLVIYAKFMSTSVQDTRSINCIKWSGNKFPSLSGIHELGGSRKYSTKKFPWIKWVITWNGRERYFANERRYNTQKIQPWMWHLCLNKKFLEKYKVYFKYCFIGRIFLNPNLRLCSGQVLALYTPRQIIWKW